MSTPPVLEVAVPVLRNLMLGVPLMVACILLQAFLMVTAMRFYRRRVAGRNDNGLAAAVAVVAGVMVLLVLGNMVQVALWGLLFRLLGEFDALGEAVYHSAVNFAALGYGDIVMSSRHKLLGPLEAINGVVMIGLSTAVLLEAFRDALRMGHAGEVRQR